MSMGQHSESSTIRYYDKHAEDYVSATAHVDMGSLYRSFLTLVPEGGTILDAGCGSGRDTKAFVDRGYQVTSIDASARMVEAATRLTEKPVQQVRFQDLRSKGEFDGIWACASLLHVPLVETDDVLERFAAALRTGGVCYLSFKEGDGERREGDRCFTDFTEDSLRERLKRRETLDIVRIWTSTDLRPSRGQERWVNALTRKV